MIACHLISSLVPCYQAPDYSHMQDNPCSQTFTKTCRALTLYRLMLLNISQRLPPRTEAGINQVHGQRHSAVIVTWVRHHDQWKKLMIGGAFIDHAIPPTSKSHHCSLQHASSTLAASPSPSSPATQDFQTS